jgi:predicted negative regulator of RcsB-dependent stress response
MSTEFLSDREQEEALRNWWRENWRWVASGVAMGCVGVGAIVYWRGHVEQTAEAAAQTYKELTIALPTNDKDKIDAVVKNLDANFSGSPYTDQAHLLLAQVHASGGRFEMAATELKTVMDKSKDEALVQVARLRLARVQIQLGHHDDALALLDVSKAGAFVAAVHEIRGDALLAKGDASGARAEYQAALDGAQGQAGNNEYLQLKLQDLAATAAPAVANVTSQAK